MKKQQHRSQDGGDGRSRGRYRNQLRRTGAGIGLGGRFLRRDDDGNGGGRIDFGVGLLFGKGMGLPGLDNHPINGDGRIGSIFDNVAIGGNGPRFSEFLHLLRGARPLYGIGFAALCSPQAFQC